MATRLPDDVMLPPRLIEPDPRPVRGRLLAFVPISIALAGVAAILLGHVTAQDIAAADSLKTVDPVQTGSIAVAPASGYGIDAVAR